MSKRKNIRRRQREEYKSKRYAPLNSRYDVANDESTWRHFDDAKQQGISNTPMTGSVNDARTPKVVTAWTRDGRTSMPHDSGYFERHDNSYHTDKSTHIPHGITHVDNPIRWETVWVDKVSTSTRSTRTIGTMNNSDRAMEQVNNKTIKRIWNKPNQ